MNVTRWHDTAFGGSFGGSSWQRLSASIEVMRNGSFVDFHVRFPGDGKPKHFIINADQLAEAIDKKHGERTAVRIECDAPMKRALREVFGQKGDQ